MGNYIDIILTLDGYFCAAPPWVVHVGDLIHLPDVVGGKNEIHEVISVVTDEKDGEHIQMIERYIGYPLPRITAKFTKTEVMWDEPV